MHTTFVWRSSLYSSTISQHRFAFIENNNSPVVGYAENIEPRILATPSPNNWRIQTETLILLTSRLSDTSRETH